MTHQHKHLKLKDLTAEGEVQAVIATLGVKDKDGDVTLKGFFGTQPAAIVSSHNWGDILLGKGTVSDADGKQALFEGRFNLEDPDAAKLHSKLRFDLDNPPALIEWSYGYDIHEGGSKRGTFEGEQVRFLQPTDDGAVGGDIVEVSPVVRGAGEGTTTVGVKSHTKFTDHLTAVVTDVLEVTNRAREIQALRAENGKTLGPESLELVSTLEAKLATLRDALASMTAEAETLNGLDVTAEFVKFQASLAQLRGDRTI